MSINIFGIAFHLYGLVLGLGVLASFEASVWFGKSRGIDKEIAERLFFWVVVGGIIGARLYHVIDKWKEIYSLNPISVLYLWNGGLGIWGAIIGGIVGLLFYFQRSSGKKNSKNQFLNLLDVACFGVPLGQAIGRWGNFFNNEIVGKNGEPLFLYESLLNVLLFSSLVVVSRRSKKIGVISGLYLAGYGIIRLVLEPLRPDSIIWKIYGIPAASLVALSTIAVGSFLIFRKRS